jgi:hypothetical protein
VKKKKKMMMMKLVKKIETKMIKKKLRRGLLDPEDEGITILRNFGNTLIVSNTATGSRYL